jgi:hypothetical protein
VNMEETKLGSEVDEKRGREEEETTWNNIQNLKIAQVPNFEWDRPIQANAYKTAEAGGTQH